MSSNRRKVRKVPGVRLRIRSRAHTAGPDIDDGGSGGGAGHRIEIDLGHLRQIRRRCVGQAGLTIPTTERTSS